MRASSEFAVGDLLRPRSWFLAKRIADPSVLAIAEPGLGKSAMSSKMVLGLAAQGYTLLIPGDTTPRLRRADLAAAR